MPEPLIDLPYDLRALTATLVTEDDTPVDNLFSARQRRLLVEPLYSSWQPPMLEDVTEPRVFLADSEVAMFGTPYQSAVAPDMFLSLDVEPNPAYIANEHRSYFVWEYGKAAEVAVEIVSNRKGKEMDGKMRQYGQMGIYYYVVFDPFGALRGEKLLVHELTLNGRRYRRRPDFLLPEVGLSLQLWHGEFEAMTTEWLRWCDAAGNLIPTGEERALAADQRAQDADQRAQAADDRARIADGRAQAEAVARQAAESELEKLRAELQRLQSSP